MELRKILAKLVSFGRSRLGSLIAKGASRSFLVKVGGATADRTASTTATPLGLLQWGAKFGKLRLAGNDD